MPVPSSPQQYKFLHFSFILLICSIVIGITQELITISQPLQPPPSLPSTPYPTSSACHSTKDCNPSHLIGKKIKKREKSPHFFYLVAGGDIMLSRNIGYYNKQS
ncbi:MAG: hypothetical protein LBP53_04835 [Candidatus Peribacteria bacterium]|nr:hypothetical protein [Candidatus Peribacteria bacterium]